MRVEKTLAEYELDVHKHVLEIITDTASNVMGISRVLDIPGAGCVDHKLALTVNDGLDYHYKEKKDLYNDSSDDEDDETARGFFKRLACLTAHFKKSPKATEELNAIQRGE